MYDVNKVDNLNKPKIPTIAVTVAVAIAWSMAAIRRPWQVKRVKGGKVEHESIWTDQQQPRRLCWRHPSKSNAMLHLGHSDQDLQPKYAKPWPEASEVG